MTDYETLPFYEEKATPEEKQESLIMMGKQVSLLMDQEKPNVPLTKVKSTLWLFANGPSNTSVQMLVLWNIFL